MEEINDNELKQKSATCSLQGIKADNDVKGLFHWAVDNDDDLLRLAKRDEYGRNVEHVELFFFCEEN